MGKEVHGDTRPVVLDHDLHVGIDALEARLHASSLGRELDGVGEEVPYDLLKPVGVARDRSRRRVQDQLQPDLLRLRGRGDGLRRLLDDLRQRDGTDVEAHLACDDPGDVEEVRDELVLGQGVPVDGVCAPAHGLRLHVLAAEDVRPAHDGVQRRAQLVGEGGQELVLDPVGLLRLPRALGLRPVRFRVGRLQRAQQAAQHEGGGDAEHEGEEAASHQQARRRAGRALLALRQEPALVVEDPADGVAHGVHLRLPALQPLQEARLLRDVGQAGTGDRVLRAPPPDFIAGAKAVDAHLLRGIVGDQGVQALEGLRQLDARRRVGLQEPGVAGEQEGAQPRLVIHELLVHLPGLPDDLVGMHHRAVVAEEGAHLPGQEAAQEPDDEDRDGEDEHDGGADTGANEAPASMAGGGRGAAGAVQWRPERRSRRPRSYLDPL